MFDYKLIEALALVCEKGGFERAAGELLISQSAVSQRIRQLEDQLGTPLVIRESPPTPTAVGEKLVAHYNKVKQLENDLRAQVQPSSDGEFLTLPIGVNEDSMAFWFTDAIATLTREHNITLHISVDDQDETHKLLKSGKVLGCVSSKREPLQGCSVSYLGRIDYYCLATSEFVKKWFPGGATLYAFAKAPAVIYSTKDRAHEYYLCDTLEFDHFTYPHHFIPSSHGFLDAIRNGLGYGLVQTKQALELMEEGEVIELTPGERLPLHLYWHHWDLDAGPIKRLTRALVEFARNKFPQHDEPVD